MSFPTMPGETGPLLYGTGTEKEEEEEEGGGRDGEKVVCCR